MKRNDEDLDGLLGMYVNEGCLGGNEEMEKATEFTLKRFDSKERVWDIFEFFGANMASFCEGVLSIM